MANKGKITAVIGPVVDVSFEKNQLPEILNALEIKKEDEERRVSKLQIHMREPYDASIVLSIPSSIWQLNNLTHLNLSFSYMRALPLSIGRLKSLEVLDLSYTSGLLELPEEIGDLTNLIKLVLDYLRITFLPSSIGRLKKLTDLSLYRTERIIELPKEIGAMENLVRRILVL